MKKQKEWHSPQCQKRSKSRLLAGCWCYMIPKWNRELLDAEAKAAK